MMKERDPMTAQMPDLFRYEGVDYDLAGISAGGLFSPSQLGLEPKGTCTACWRGYQAVFALAGSRPVLDTLRVELYKPGKGYRRLEGPRINDVAPVDGQGGFNNHYVGMDYPLDYTGGLLLARGFVRELYVHMGFHPAWKYTDVVELVFEDGVLQRRFDRSERMAQIRQRILESAGSGKRAGPRAPEEVREFIQRSFDRTYRM